MRLFPNDSQYTALMLSLDREQARELRDNSRELRNRSAELVAAARRLRARSARSTRRTAEVLKACEEPSMRRVTSIAERAAKFGFRFDVRGLRDFVLIDERTGETYDFETSDALRDFLRKREEDRRQERDLFRGRRAV